MKKHLPIVVAIILLVVGGFLIWNTNTTGVEFNPKEVAVGDQYGIFTVIKVWYMPSTPSYPDNLYNIDFSGTTTIAGVFGQAPDTGCFIPLENIATSTMQQLPRSVLHPQISHTLNLDVDDIPTADLPSAGDAVEVTIDRYVSAYTAKTCGGDYGHVTSIKKI